MQWYGYQRRYKTADWTMLQVSARFNNSVWLCPKYLYLQIKKLDLK